MIYGIFSNLVWWHYIVITLVLTHITIAAVTIYLHRCQAHRALDLHPIVSHFFRFWLWFTTGQVTKAWAAIHRKHHAKCETEEDPHSPVKKGLKTILLFGTELYRHESKNKETLERYGKGTPDDWIERNVYTKYSVYGVVLLLITQSVLFGIPGVIIWAVQMSWIPFFAAGIINGVGHYWGYRNFECSDAATNIIPWGILIGGEELHNNHHTFSTSAKLSVKWWEFDIGWMYIKTLSLFGLAKVKKVAPKPKLVAEKNSIDVDTVKSIITNRFQVMATYTKKVIKPVIISELSHVESRFKLALVKLMSRNDAILTEQHKEQLSEVLNTHKSLDVIYSFKRSLQQVWDRAASTQKELLDSLQQWCHDAENTGIEALKDFAKTIRSYSVAEANS